jgi:DNA polymerase-1
MTAQNGLHNLPAPLRPAVAAHPGHVFVRADLGQIEPRVLAAVSGDRRFAAAAQSDDLYAPVAADLGVDRPVAKVAVLAAMYGQTSGPAGEALRGMERSYPVALAYLRSAADAGAAGRAVQTYGGRRVPVPTSDTPAGRAAHGRFARNAVVQGAAAELFKAWAATVRAACRPLDARIVLCLHDELLVHAPEPVGDQVADVLRRTLADVASRWARPVRGPRVRFVADVTVVQRWSQAKG